MSLFEFVSLALPRAGTGAKHFSNLFHINCSQQFCKTGAIIYSIYTQENSGLEDWSNVPKTTQLVNG